MKYNGKYMKPSVRKSLSAGTLVMRTAMVLLSLLLVSTCLMGGLLAKYTAADSGSDEARVARFEVSATDIKASDIFCTASQSNDGSYTFTIKNDSEVSVQYSINVTMSGAAADGVTATVDTAEGVLAPNSTSGEHNLTFKVTDWSKVTDTVKGSSSEVVLDFAVAVLVEQID